MLKLTSKFKFSQAQKLLVMAMMLATTSAWSGEIFPLLREGSPEKIAEEIAFCQQLNDTIEQTPDFWERFDKEGFYYILTASPFKHRHVEKIHPVVVLTAGLHNYLREKQWSMSDWLFWINNNGEYGEPLKSHNGDSLESLLEEVDVSKQYFYQDLDMDKFDWGENYKEKFLYRYIDHDPQKCESDCFQLGIRNNFLAYRIKSNFYNQWDMDEYTIGIMNYDVSNANQEKQSEFYVVDKYMQPYPKAHSRKSLSYNMPSGYPFSIAAYDYYISSFVPIYVNGRSYEAKIRYQPYFEQFEFSVQKMHYKNGVDLLCILDFSKKPLIKE